MSKLCLELKLISKILVERQTSNSYNRKKLIDFSVCTKFQGSCRMKAFLTDTKSFILSGYFIR